MAKRADKTRRATSKAKVKASTSDMEILDKYPKEVAYPNPPGMMYVRARVTYDDGSDPVEGIYLLTTDQINRIEKSK